ncbi:MAG TPA: YceD family protein [Steroidobacteraceae bacterium]|nr:YceD family protein [Steroidobacteraceae bacterium]
MPRAPAASDFTVDAKVQARARNLIEYHFTAADLPRLTQAGAGSDSVVDVRLSFSEYDTLPAIHGSLHGTVMLECQRCLDFAPIGIRDEFNVVIVDRERSDEPGGYEPIVADAGHLDVRWLTEEQVLLSLPLVALHEDENCGDRTSDPTAAAPNDEEEIRQQPFKNLRDLLRKD